MMKKGIGLPTQVGGKRTEPFRNRKALGKRTLHLIGAIHVVNHMFGVSEGAWYYLVRFATGFESLSTYNQIVQRSFP